MTGATKPKASENANVTTSVAAVVVTLNRIDRLRKWLDCVRAQYRLPDHIVVVDNGSDDGTQAMVSGEFPEAILVQLDNNPGQAAAAAAGLQKAIELDCEWVWVFDDDAYPSENGLNLALSIAEEKNMARPGMIWLPSSDLAGWNWRVRKIRLSLHNESFGGKCPIRVDHIDLNMTLVSREMVERIGLPREDYFFMLWELEYCLRALDAGYSIWVAPEILVQHECAGATALWRTYYQTRNLVALSISRRSLRAIFFCSMLQARFLVGILLKADRKKQRLYFRLRGIWDGVRGVMGKTIDPMDYRNP